MIVGPPSGGNGSFYRTACQHSVQFLESSNLSCPRGYIDIHWKIMKNAITSKLALALCMAALSSSALADTDSSTLTVGATVQNNCAIGNGSLSFGTTRTLAVTKGAGTAGTIANIDADSGSSISIICTLGATATINADTGANASAGVRRMLSGSDHLAYQLYTDADRLTVLNTTTGSINYTGTGAATTTTAIYGRIDGAALQAAKAGTYVDTVGLTVTYTP